MSEQQKQSSASYAHKKRALVLSGGGSRGAYEVGVVKALVEHGLEFDLAFGTSIGGINAAFIAQDKIKRLEELWSSISATDIFRFPSFTQIRHILTGSRWGLLDTSPLEKMLYRELELSRFKQSRTQVGLLSTDLCTLHTKLTTTSEIESLPHLVDVLMAASAIPVLFPARNLNGGGFWIDAGLVRNTPIQTAINMGAQEIYIVLVQAEHDGACPTNIMQVLARCADMLLYASARDGIKQVKEYNRMIDSEGTPDMLQHRIDLKVFQPGGEVTSTLLDINPGQSKILLRLGYEDAVKQLIKQ